MTGRSGHGADPPWTWVQEELLAWKARHGWSAAEIAELINRSPAAVYLKAGRMGIRLHATGGAPAGNRYGAATWYKPGPLWQRSANSIR